MPAKFTVTGVLGTLFGRRLHLDQTGGVHVDGDLVGRTGGTAQKPVMVEVRVLSGTLDSVDTPVTTKVAPEIAVGSVSCGMDLTCGNVGGDVDAGMEVSCGAVAGSVNSGMDVNVTGSVTGRVQAGMDVTVQGDVHGSIDAGMSVKVAGKRV